MDLRQDFVRQLDQLHDELSQLSQCVENIFNKAAYSACTTASKKSPLPHEKQILRDKERSIETLALRLLLLQQPVAGDLREVSGALKVVSDFKRIGDLSIEIIAMVSDLDEQSHPIQENELSSMIGLVKNMVSQSFKAYLSHDVDRALETAPIDARVDTYLQTISSVLSDQIENKHIEGHEALTLLMIAKYFERIADHAESICYWTEYVKLGTRKGMRM